MALGARAFAQGLGMSVACCMGTSPAFRGRTFASKYNRPEQKDGACTAQFACPQRHQNRRTLSCYSGRLEESLRESILLDLLLRGCPRCGARRKLRGRHRL